MATNAVGEGPSNAQRLSDNRNGVALLIVMMIILGLLILGQAAMLLLDQVALRSGTYRRQEAGGYCAEEGLNLGRAWLLGAMAGNPQLPPTTLNWLLADPTDPTATGINGLANANKDLCLIGTGMIPLASGTTIPGLSGWCRTDSAGNPLYRINLVDDLDEPPPNANPIKDENNVFILRAECLDTNTILRSQATGQSNQDVAMVEINQAGSSSCYGLSSGANAAGCGGGYAN